jgi:hypothetical protein
MATTPLTGSLPGERGFGSQKRPPDCLAYRAFGEPPSACAAAHRARRRGYTVTCSCVNTLFGDSTKLQTVSSPFLLQRERHQEASIYNGIMNPQYPDVDENSSCVDAARSLDMYIVSASPSSYYVQGSIQNNLHAFSNLQ